MAVRNCELIIVAAVVLTCIYRDGAEGQSLSGTFYACICNTVPLIATAQVYTYTRLINSVLVNHYVSGPVLGIVNKLPFQLVAIVGTGILQQESSLEDYVELMQCSSKLLKKCKLCG